MNVDLSREEIMLHMKKGGQFFRVVPRRKFSTDRFFYKLSEDNVLLCRVNELGGWNKAIVEPRWNKDAKHRDFIEVATNDYTLEDVALADYDSEELWCNRKVVLIPLPSLKDTLGE